MYQRCVTVAVCVMGLALASVAPSSGQTFTGPTTGGGSTGKVVGAHFIYNDWVFPVVSNRVKFPDCTSFAVSPAGVLSGRAMTPNCKPGAGAPEGRKIRGQVQQRTMADGRVMTIVIDPDRPAEITVIDDGKSTPSGAGSGQMPRGQTSPDPFQLDPAATRKIPGQPPAKVVGDGSKGQQSADPFKLDDPAGSASKASPPRPAKAQKPPCDPKLKPGTKPVAGGKPPCDPKKAPVS